jgi:hypothetical protein
MIRLRKKKTESANTSERVVITEPHPTELKKVWLHEVDSLLRSTVAFSFLLQLGTLLMGKNATVSVDSYQLQTIYVGAFLWVAAFVVLVFDINRRRKRMIERSPDLLSFKKRLDELERSNAETQIKLNDLKEKTSKLEEEDE